MTLISRAILENRKFICIYLIIIKLLSEFPYSFYSTIDNNTVLNNLIEYLFLNKTIYYT